ncbi:hypothetical protein D3C78_1352920 [compost metagenome]
MIAIAIILKVQQQLGADECRRACKARRFQHRQHLQGAFTALVGAVHASRNAQAHAVAGLGRETLGSAGTENHLAAHQRTQGRLEQWVVCLGGDDLDVFGKAAALTEQVGLGIERAGLANGECDFRSLAQLFKPVAVVVAAAEHLDFQVARVAQQLLLQLADHPVLESEQQQQWGDHRHQRSGHAQGDLAVVPEVGQRQLDQQAEAPMPGVQSVSLLRR